MKHQKSRKYITSAFKNGSKSAEALKKNQGRPHFFCLQKNSFVIACAK